MSVRSAGVAQLDLDPSDLAGQTHLVANYFQAIKSHEANRIHASGVGAKTPTTPSSQLTGAGVTEWRIDLDAIMAAVDGVLGEIPGQADLAIHSGSNLLANGESVVAALVAKNVSGVISLEVVKGAPAVTGSELAPGDAAIRSAVGAGNAWVKISECTLNRTGDLTLTQVQNNSKRPVLGINVSTEFGFFAG